MDNDDAIPKLNPRDPRQIHDLRFILHFLQSLADHEHPGHKGGAFRVRTGHGVVVLPIRPAPEPPATGWVIVPAPARKGRPS